MRQNITKKWRFATLAMGGTVCMLIVGCSTGQKGRRGTEAEEVTRLAHALAGAACEGYHVISLEQEGSRCTDLPGSRGRWKGQPVSTIGGAVYCSYSWHSDSIKTGSSSVLGPVKGPKLTPSTTIGKTTVPAASSPPRLQARLVGATPASAGGASLAHGKDNPGGKPVKPSATGPYRPDHGVLERLRRVEIDCPVIASLAPVGPNDPLWRETQLKTHRAQAGWLPKLPGTKTSVQVAVVDTAARPYTSHLDDAYGHGRTMGRVIADLACPLDGKSGCPVDVVNHLAMPLKTPAQADYIEGGYYGTRGHLARAISEAVSHWRAEATERRASRLVINLSVGWDGTHGGDFRKSFQELDLASQAVYASLAYASCSGALPIAAAGNRSAPSDSGPMYPAGWEANAAPDEKLCAAYGWPEPPNALPVHGEARYNPLVYAVGGVDAGDRPLANMRPGAQPRLVGHALAVVARDPLRGDWTETLTGTSLAAAVGSGVAAAAWAYAPQRTSHELMEIIYKTSVALNLPQLSTEHCLPALGPCSGYQVHRLSACETIANMTASSAAALRCKTVPAEMGAAIPAGTPDITAYVTLPNASDCGPAGCPTPAATPKGEKPWVGPQPGEPICTSCYVLRVNSALYVGLKPGTETTLEKLMLRAHIGGVTATYDIPRPGTQYPASFATTVPGVHGALFGELIAYHSAGPVSVPTLVSNEAPVPVF